MGTDGRPASSIQQRMSRVLLCAGDQERSLEGQWWPLKNKKEREGLKDKIISLSCKETFYCAKIYNKKLTI